MTKPTAFPVPFMKPNDIEIIPKDEPHWVQDGNRWTYVIPPPKRSYTDGPKRYPELKDEDRIEYINPPWWRF